MAPSPKLSRQVGAQTVRLDSEMGRGCSGSSTYHQLRAWRPVLASQRRLSETRVARQEVSEGEEKTSVRGGGAPRSPTLQVGAVRPAG